MNKNRNFFLIVISVIFLSSTTWARFEIIETKWLNLSDWENLGVRAQVTQKTNKDLQNLSFLQDRYLLDIVFGKLSFQQFNALKIKYGNKSFVTYDANRIYEFIDFLPPLIQATQGKVYLTKYYDGEKAQAEFEKGTADYLFPIVKNGISSFTNCYNTTKEFLRLSSNSLIGSDYFFEVTWPSRDDANSWFAWFENQQNPWGRKLNREEPIQFGDILVVANISPMLPPNFNSLIYHTAVILNSTLAFEKTDSSSNDPFRISYIADIISKYSGTDFNTVEKYIFRPSPQGLQKFPLIMATANDPQEDEILAAADRLYRSEGLDNRKVHFACETGLGGGCDPILMEAERVYFQLNPTTWRAELYGDPQVVSRFQDLN